MRLDIQKMNSEKNEDVFVVTFSRRNILALLHKLDMKGSARRLEKLVDEGLLVVTVEEDEEHYSGQPAGPMHPETEKFISHNTHPEHSEDRFTD